MAKNIAENITKIQLTLVISNTGKSNFCLTKRK